MSQVIDQLSSWLLAATPYLAHGLPDNTSDAAWYLTPRRHILEFLVFNAVYGTCLFYLYKTRHGLRSQISLRLFWRAWCSAAEAAASAATVRADRDRSPARHLAGCRRALGLRVQNLGTRSAARVVPVHAVPHLQRDSGVQVLYSLTSGAESHFWARDSQTIIWFKVSPRTELIFNIYIYNCWPQCAFAVALFACQISPYLFRFIAILTPDTTGYGDQGGNANFVSSHFFRLSFAGSQFEVGLYWAQHILLVAVPIWGIAGGRYRLYPYSTRL